MKRAADIRRNDWTTADEFVELFVLRRGELDAHYEVKAHPLGWECRLVSGALLLQWTVCQSRDEVLGTGEEWKAAMVRQGWDRTDYPPFPRR